MAHFMVLKGRFFRPSFHGRRPLRERSGFYRKPSPLPAPTFFRSVEEQNIRLNQTFNQVLYSRAVLRLAQPASDARPGPSDSSVRRSENDLGWAVIFLRPTLRIFQSASSWRVPRTNKRPIGRDFVGFRLFQGRNTPRPGHRQDSLDEAKTQFSHKTDRLGNN